MAKSRRLGIFLRAGLLLLTDSTRNLKQMKMKSKPIPPSVVEEVKKRIGSGDTGNAIEVLFANHPADEVIALQHRFKTYLSEKLKGLYTGEEDRVIINRINHDLLELLTPRIDSGIAVRVKWQVRSAVTGIFLILALIWLFQEHYGGNSASNNLKTAEIYSENKVASASDLSGQPDTIRVKKTSLPVVIIEEPTIPEPGKVHSARDAAFLGKKLRGAIYDENNHPLGGVSVEVDDPNELLAGTATTDSTGRFTLDARFPHKDYILKLRFFKSGYTTESLLFSKESGLKELTLQSRVSGGATGNNPSR